MLDEETGKFYWGEDVVQLSERETKVLGCLIWYKGRLLRVKKIDKICFGTIRDDGKYMHIRTLIQNLKEKLGKYIEIKISIGKGYYL